MKNTPLYRNVALGVLSAGVIGSLLNHAALAASIPLQDNPVFTTPAPVELDLGKKDAFAKDLVKTESPDFRVEDKKLGKIEFEGNHYYRDSVVENQIKFLEEKQDRLLAPGELEKSLQQLNKNNTFKLKAIVKAGTSPDIADVKLDVYERQPWQISTTMDNQGRPRIGTLRGGVQLSNESLLGFGDKLNLQYLGAQDTNYFQGGYDFPINRYGGTVGLMTEFTHHNVDLSPFADRTGEQYALGVRYIQPLDRKRIWTGDIGFMARHVNVNNLHADPRFLFAGLKFNRPDRYGLSQAYLQTFLGGDYWLGGMGGDSKFWRVRGQGARVFKLPYDNKLVLRGAAQYSPDALIPVQMFPITGVYNVRGYSEGLLYTDSGYFVSLEHYWPIPFLSKINPVLHDRVRGVSFFDAGGGWLRKSRNAPVDNTTVLAAGVGLRYRLTQYMQGFVDFAWGLGHHDNFNSQNLVGTTINPSMRIHFGVRSDLLSKAFAKRD